MNEWMFYWPNIRKFQCWEEESGKGGDQKEEGGVVEGKVSYLVGGDLQITYKYHIISLKLDFK